jgi:ATP/maltotriose-dependent transcriptional regulator MalT
MSRPRTAEEWAGRGRSAAEGSEWEKAFEAFAHADEGEEALDEPDLRLYGMTAYLLGRVDRAVDVLARAYQLSIDANRPEDAAIYGFWVIFILLGRGEVARAGGWIGRCSSLLEQLSEEALPHAYMNCLHAFRAVAVDREYARAHLLAEDAIAGARSHQDRDLLALALNIDGRALIRVGRVGEGMERLDEAMVELVSGGLTATVAGTVYCSMIDACEEIHEVQRAREWTDALSDWCDRQNGMLTFNGQCLTHRATILRQHGRWKEAVAEAERARDRFVGAADEQATGRALYEIGEIHRLRGDHAAAEEAYQRAGSWGHDPQPGLALLRLAQGRTEAAVATMRRLVGEATDPLDRIRQLPAYVEVMVAAGEIDEATTGTRELTELAGVYGTVALRAQADHAAGTVALAADETERALIPLRRACRNWQELRSPYEEARTRTLLAEACEAIGDADGAHLERTAAARLFEQLGIDPERGVSTAPDHGLSPRELEVLRLVATGMTNQEIADELILAVKTIDRHVGSILAKLGVPTRTAATAYAYQHGLV